MVIVITGPTATGKSDLGIFLAKKLNGEIINADSTQVYEGMNIATNKIKTIIVITIPMIPFFLVLYILKDHSLSINFSFLHLLKPFLIFPNLPVFFLCPLQHNLMDHLQHILASPFFP